MLFIVFYRSVLLETNDTFKYAEERRLFYVALTRVKEKVTLLVKKDSKSEFVKELETDFNIFNETYVCPKCGGKLHLTKGNYGNFLGVFQLQRKRL